MPSLRTVGAVTLAFAGLASAKKVKINAMEHDIQEIQGGKFDAIISKNREMGVAAIWYYHPHNSADGAFLDMWNNIAKKTKKLIRIAAINCKENSKQCERDGVTDTPHIHVYPPQPQPAYKYSGELDEDKIIKKLYKAVIDKTTTLGDIKAYTEFKSKNPTKPKVFLFSEKDKAPLILKGLSSETVFHRTMEFAFVPGSAKDVVSEAGAGRKKLPAVLLLKAGKKKWYKDGKATKDDLTFLDLHEWINVQSESGMGDSVKVGGQTQEVEDVVGEPYIEEKVRELHAKSHRELCFGQKNMCGIFVSDGPMGEKDTDMMVEFENKFSSKGDRGVKYNWMWMDISVETEFKAALVEAEQKRADKEGDDVLEIKYPTMIFVKPPKKKREEKFLAFARLGNAVSPSEDAVADITEKISGGTSYNRVGLPKFVVRKKPAKKEEL